MYMYHVHVHVQVQMTATGLWRRCFLIMRAAFSRFLIRRSGYGGGEHKRVAPRPHRPSLHAFLPLGWSVLRSRVS